jgi:hypothetical protein
VKLLIVSLLTVAAAGPAAEEMITVPKSSAEMLVQENIKLRGWVDGLIEQNNKLRKHIDKLQSSSNCS